MTTQEMMKADCPAGYWFKNTAALGEAPDWQLEVMPPVCDPNDTRLFGYDRDAFLAKQYK